MTNIPILVLPFFRMKNHVGSVVFTCRTIHSAQLMQSVVQVFYHDKLAATGQLIASDQLPLPTQVGVIMSLHHAKKEPDVNANSGSLYGAFILCL